MFFLVLSQSSALRASTGFIKSVVGLKDDYRLWWTSIVESVVIVISPQGGEDGDRD